MIRFNFYKIQFTFLFLIVFSINGFTQDSRTTIHEVIVLEVLQVSSYTYLYVDENSAEKWVAVPSTIVKVGDVLFYKGGSEMIDFKSNELGKIFASVLFLEKITKNKEDFENKALKMPFSDLHQGDSKKEIERLAVSINPVNDGITIAELLKNKKLYEGKTVKIKGQVIKFNAKIMSRNWLHIQDGTEFMGEYDLTFTTNDVVTVGDVVVLEGIVALDKDFGYGYFYNLIVEDSQLIEE